ncbi:MAG: hypothetical protein ABEI06_05180 [Halobacteriaceae archaeon]
MKRRKYLASVVGLTASTGCLGRIASGNVSDPNKVVSVINARGHVEGNTVTVEVVDDEITPDSTARISLRFTNESNQTIKLHFRPDHPEPLHSEPDDVTPALMLFSDTFNPERVSPHCWKPKEVPAFRPVLTEYRLNPGHSVTMEYEVWASPNQDADCIQAKKYLFEHPEASFELQVTQ